ncbi:MAG: serine/threonine protein kinase [Bryobacterales bacterium]|nr:serine/threonine protein kinase [Bryobacterales bacterium]
MDQKRRREADQLFRGAIGRLINSVLAHGRVASGGPLDNPSKGSSVDLDSDPTVTFAAPAPPLGFQPGAILAQRYRIVHLLGRGGMGEVYRADDLVLGQAVALKFLPPAATAEASALSRFRNEVRTARQISHPNICRVYDIGEAEGLTYLSMEYVDGEDLASLLRRIGKLPQDKALEVARQICAGLAAAHDKGVIHRDLKPANVMLDGKGSVRITDFGLAGIAAHIRDVRSGTPAYMSPEQIAGKEVTPRSDIYALGIVLHELLTGKRPPLDPGDADLGPEIAPVVQRCLEPNPQRRPESVLQVSAALPGGDPLAAALARGETPAPEVVANAGPIEGLRPSVAAACLAVAILGLGLLCVLRQRHDLINQIPMENSSEVLAAKAREIARSFGYTEKPVDTLFAWQYDTDYLRYASEQKNTLARDARLYAPYPPAIYFWSRQSPHYPINSDVTYEQYSFNRDTLEPGMQAVVLDSEGRLLEFQARPPAVARSEHRTELFDWDKLFAAAGLDVAAFKAVQPQFTPGSPFDAQAAWTGSAEGENLRVEAAAYEGRPVSFRVLEPWTRPSEPTPVSFGSFSTPTFVLGVLVLPAVAGLLAWRNARTGRGDRRGAFRVAGFLFLVSLLAFLAATHHVPTVTEFVILFSALRYALAFAALGWVLYMGFEPQLRRRDPESLISWNRLLAGRLRDPMVGGHLLGGVAFGVLAFSATDAFAPLRFVSFAAPKVAYSFFSLWCGDLIAATAGGLSFALLLHLISTVIRPRWLRVPVFVLVATLLLSPGYGVLSFATVARPTVVFLILGVTLARFGVLATVAVAYVAFVTQDFPLTTNWSAWYARPALFGMATLVGLALFGFVTTLRSRSLSSHHSGRG